MHFAKATCLATLTFMVLLTHTAVEGRQAIDSENRQPPSFQAANPSYQIASHIIGNINLPVANNGTLGMQFYPRVAVDAFTGEQIPSWQFPKESVVDYLYGGALWVGAIVYDSLFDTLIAGDTLPNGDTIPPGSTVVVLDTIVDTLVSEGYDGWSRQANELLPDESPFGDMIKRSTIDPTESDLFAGAISHEDYIAVYTDTFPDSAITRDPDYFNNRPHIPLNIEVSQKSFSWGYSHTEDFVLIEYSITNIGTKNLNSVYAGLYIDDDVCFDCPNGGYQDDLAGFRSVFPSAVFPDACGFSDTLNIAWIADNDGDFDRFPNERALHVTGISIVDVPDTGSLTTSFNWWLSSIDSTQDWGPRRVSDTLDPGTAGNGTPKGDINKYRYLSNGEIDYNQPYTATITQTDSVWQYPDPAYSANWAIGGDARFLLSFGPFSIDSGQTLPLVFAYIGGENIHTDPTNIDNLPADPAAYSAGLDFSDLARNAAWANWVYDNPGFDTDSDGYRGEMQICASTGDTSWYKGDGVPDYKVPSVTASGMVYGLQPDSVDCAVYDSVALMWRRPFSNHVVHLYSADGTTMLATTFTDQCGMYSIDIPLAADFCLGIDEAPCTYSLSTTMNSGDTTGLDINIPSILASGMVYGFQPDSVGCAVFDSSAQLWRRPVADYKVYLYSDSADGSRVLDSASTDSCGLYSMEVPFGGIFCLGLDTITPCFYTLDMSTNTTDTANLDFRIDYVLASGMVYDLQPDSVDCVVFDSTTMFWRQPVADYEVSLYSADGNTLLNTVRTNSCGLYTIKVPLNGDFCLGIQNAHCLHSLSTTVNSVDTTGLDIRLPRILASGMVYDYGPDSVACSVFDSSAMLWRQPISSYGVRLFSADGTTILASAFTDSCGLYTIEVPLPGDFCLGVDGTHCLYSLHTVTNSTDTTGLDIRISSITASGMVYDFRPDSVSCAVFDSAAMMWREPVVGYSVYLYSPDGVSVKGFTTTDSCGLYSLDVALPADFCLGVAGDHCLYSLHTTANSSDTTGLDIRVSSIMADGMVYSLGPDSVSCAVYDSSAMLWRQPIAGYEVRLYNAAGTTMLSTVLTDTCGLYSLQVDLPGDFCVGVEADHCLYPLQTTENSTDTSGLNINVTPIHASGIIYSYYRDSVACAVYDSTTQSWRKPAADHTVYLYSSSLDTLLASVLTDTCGSYSIDIPLNGEFCLGIDGASCQYTILTTLGSTDTTGLDIRVPFMTASGMVYDLQADSVFCAVFDSSVMMWKHPVADYEVRLYSADGVSVVATALSDSCGLYSIEVPLNSVFCLGADINLCIYPLNTTVISNDTTDLDINTSSVLASGMVFKLGPDSVNCAVYDSSANLWRQPYINVPVSVYASDSISRISTTKTDSCGMYSLAIPLTIDVCLGVNQNHCLYSIQTTLGSTDITNLNIDLTGIPTDIDNGPSDLPLSFGLTQNYPNPFNPATMISYTLATRSLVELSVYNMLGQKVTTLVNEVVSAGEHQIEWDGTNQSGNRVASGIYFYRLDTGYQSVVKKMVLLK